MDLKQTLDKYKREIDNGLGKFFDERIKRAEKIDDAALDLMKHLKEFTLRGGKRIRPILLVFGYKAVGGRDEKEIIKAALAVELMQSFLLIHDDVIDEDEMRRGYFTMHKIYENKCKREYPNQNAAKFGRDMAIMAGDILSILATEVILDTKFPYKLKTKAMEKLNRVIINTGFGEVLDILSEIKSDIKESDISKIHKLKTAFYTVEGPLYIGALLGKANNSQLKILTDFSIQLGQAFQIQDDILGMFGTVETIGKPIGSDIREGKRTLLIIKALEKAEDKDKKTIMKCLGNRNITKRDIENIKHIIIKTGSLDYSKNLAEELVGKAKSCLRNGSFKKEGKEFLLWLADYVVKREY